MNKRVTAFLEGLSDPEYRRLFAAEIVGVSLAFQLRRLRESRGWTAEELAQRIGETSETIDQWEDPNYAGEYFLSELQKLAAAFDVGLLARFVSFAELADWVVDVAPERQTPPSYNEFTTTADKASAE